MRICGIQKTSLVDYPGQMATVIFTGGCNFNCPYCHNSQLIPRDVEPEYTVGATLDLLYRRKHLIDSVVISGGEPTLQPDLHGFISKIKNTTDFKVKLDTNGSNPDVLKKLIDDGLVDYVAMDIKHDELFYWIYADFGKGTDDSTLLSGVKKSIDILKRGLVPYEFRTTAVKGLHTWETFEEIGRWIEGAENYYIQNFRAVEGVVSEPFKPFTENELNQFASIVGRYVKHARVRGI